MEYLRLFLDKTLIVEIPNLEGPRARCCKDGIISSDVIMVPLEDGDRCEHWSKWVRLSLSLI